MTSQYEVEQNYNKFEQAAPPMSRTTKVILTIVDLGGVLALATGNIHAAAAIASIGGITLLTQPEIDRKI